MNSPEYKNIVCRICLDDNVAFDWNNTLIEHSDVTYKDCYYKYTQLTQLDDDPLSSMLCENCSNSLEDVHSLIMKAVDSHNFLVEVNCVQLDTEEAIIENDNENCISMDFETVLVENAENGTSVTSDSEDMNTEELQYQDSFDGWDDENHGTNRKSSDKGISMDYRTRRKNYEHDMPSKKKLENKVEFNLQKSTTFNTRHKNDLQNLKLENESNETKTKNSGVTKAKKNLNCQNTPRMCSYCSKILHNKYALQKHEKIHLNRERKVPCPVCGVKFLEESHVKLHMKIHDQDRVKKHKCEFCDKAFFEKGSLNVHRRIHLGQMIPCTLCSKEFFRQVDVDIHMNSHSANPINAKTRKRSRYWVRCKYCKKDIMSTSFKAHNAAHLNEPQMKCSICDREYFFRDSCKDHLKTIHKISPEEYNNFIIVYNKNRLSHLFLEQTTELKK